jgi:hypothetical protein
MANANGRCWEITPAATGNGVNVGATNTTALVLNIDIVILEDLGSEIFKVSSYHENWEA